ncbi:MAG TPA: hypothetical protein VGV35_03530 [Bryobacteraceae bacterium]|nr:hypothetical protein [Bryobacteraceae bacterium]
MATKQDVLENLVMTELLQLHKDHSLLETLHDRLPDNGSQPKVEARFLSLWADVEHRADRLEELLDRMAWFRRKPAGQVVSISQPLTSPPAA